MNDNEIVSMGDTLALLDRLKTEMPEMWGEAQVVGNWVWLEFSMPPVPTVRNKLKELGFHWNSGRKCWQHPCGVRKGRSSRDPRGTYAVVPAPALEMRETATGVGGAAISAKEFKVVALRECPLPEEMQMCDTPQKAADYWRLHCGP